MIVSYWADGPGSETPPGHWNLLAHFVSHRDHHDLDDDVKLFFALGNALLDASIAAWDAKVAFDYIRPISAIRYLFAGTLVEAWAGPNQGTQPIDGGTWQPYIQTPPFAEYVSGHSTFSAAAASVLEVHGTPVSGASVTLPAGSSPIEPGLVPAEDVTLAWRTFDDAADQAGPCVDLAGFTSRTAIDEHASWARRSACRRGIARSDYSVDTTVGGGARRIVTRRATTRPTG